MSNPAYMYQLPYPPSVNSYWRAVPGKGVLISKEGRAYRAIVIKAIGSSGLLLSGRLSVKIDAYMPDRRKRDIDNINKAVLDSLTHAGVWGDDEQIDDLQVIRRSVEKGGRVVVTVTEINKHG